MLIRQGLQAPPRPRNILVVTTCARPSGASYLIETLNGLDREGAKDLPSGCKIVLSDGDLSPQDVGRVPHSWELRVSPGSRSGPRRNLWTAFRLAVERNAERLIYTEDDIEPCRNAVKYMCKLDVPSSMALVTFHDWKEFAPGTPAGMYRLRFPGRDGRGFFGNQCIMLPRATLDYLIQQDPYAIWKSNLAKYSDRTMEAYLYMSMIWSYYACHMPCLVRHVGAVSAAHPGKLLDKRNTSNFGGDIPGFDAMSLRLNDAIDVPDGMPKGPS